MVRIDSIAERAAAILKSAGVIGVSKSADRAAAVFIGMRLHFPHPFPANTAFLPVAGVVTAIPSIHNAFVVRIDSIADRAPPILKLAGVIGVDFVADRAAAIFISVCLHFPHPFPANTAFLPVAGVVIAIPSIHNTFVVRVGSIADRAAAILKSAGVIGVDFVADRAAAIFKSVCLHFPHPFPADTAGFPMAGVICAIPASRNALVGRVSRIGM